MPLIILYAWGLVASTVTVHAIGIALALRVLRWRSAVPAQQLWPITRRLVWVACWLILLHVTEVSIWGAFYYWQECLADAESAFYFSGVTYTTIGYGDLVLAKPWRFLGPIEGLIGILMCGLSAGFFFAEVNHFYQTIHAKTDEDRKA
jgi:hypothetical protein